MSRDTITGVLSTKQFNDSFIGIVQGAPRWRGPAVAPLLLCAKRRIGKGRLGSVQANRNRLLLCYTGKPVTTKACSRHTAPAKSVPDCATKGCTGLGCGAQSHQDDFAAVRAKARVECTVPGRPHLQNMDLVVAQFEHSSKSFRCRHTSDTTYEFIDV